MEMPKIGASLQAISDASAADASNGHRQPNHRVQRSIATLMWFCTVTERPGKEKTASMFGF
jgi:hypothetical protein